MYQSNGYMMVLDNSKDGLAWEYKYEMSSPKMAIDYATKHAILLKRDMVVYYADYVGSWQFMASIFIETEVKARVVGGPDGN